MIHWRETPIAPIWINGDLLVYHLYEAIDGIPILMELSHESGTLTKARDQDPIDMFHVNDIGSHTIALLLRACPKMTESGRLPCWALCYASAMPEKRGEKRWRGIDGVTAKTRFQARVTITAHERIDLYLKIDQIQQAMLRDQADQPLERQRRPATIRRHAIAAALQCRGYLTIWRRPVHQPLRGWKAI